MSNIFKSDNQVTSRVASYSILVIDSADRSPSQPLNNFNVAQGIILASGYPTRIGLTTIYYPCATPNVNQVNNTISITNGTTIYTATVPEGFYNNAELATAIATALNSVGYSGTFTVTSDAKTFYYVVTNSTTAFAFIKTPNKTKDLLLMSGLQTNTTQALTQNGTYNSLLYTNFIDIRSNQLTRFQKILDSASDNFSDHIIERIFIEFGVTSRTSMQSLNTAQFWTRPFTIAYELVNVKWMQYLPQGEFVANTDFYLTDDQGEPIYNPVGAPNFQMKYLLSET